jgi:hypothetical protein
MSQHVRTGIQIECRPPGGLMSSVLSFYGSLK